MCTKVPGSVQCKFNVSAIKRKCFILIDSPFGYFLFNIKIIISYSRTLKLNPYKSRQKKAKAGEKNQTKINTNQKHTKL